LAQPLFKPGLKAEARAAEAGFDAAAANYRETVLQGLRQVADVLRSLEHDAQALQAQSAAEASARTSLQLVEQQYALGAASALQLLTAQQQLQQTRIGLIAAQAARLNDTALATTAATDPHRPDRRAGCASERHRPALSSAGRRAAATDAGADAGQCACSCRIVYRAYFFPGLMSAKYIATSSISLLLKGLAIGPMTSLGRLPSRNSLRV